MLLSLYLLVNFNTVVSGVGQLLTGQLLSRIVAHQANEKVDTY